MNNLIYVVILTVIPWIELRGSIPLGILQFNQNPLIVFLAAVTANILIIPIIFIFLDKFFELLHRLPLFSKIVDKTHKKAKPYVEKYGYIGLALFVGVPLPGTGAYSGSLAAHILGMKNKKAIISISIGIILAGIGVTLMSTIFNESLGWILEII